MSSLAEQAEHVRMQLGFPEGMPIVDVVRRAEVELGMEKIVHTSK